jgi:hypothetical protein
MPNRLTVRIMRRMGERDVCLLGDTTEDPENRDRRPVEKPVERLPFERRKGEKVNRFRRDTRLSFRTFSFGPVAFNRLGVSTLAMLQRQVPPS